MERLDRKPLVVVEFYGTLRSRTGTACCMVPAASLGQVVRHLLERYPSLPADWHSHCLLSVNGEAFTDDWDRPLVDGDVLLILPADAGG